jgi:hypothetical protein
MLQPLQQDRYTAEQVVTAFQRMSTLQAEVMPDVISESSLG